MPLTHVDEKMALRILHEYKIHNADVLIREDISVDDFIDVIEVSQSKQRTRKAKIHIRQIDVMSSVCMFTTKSTCVASKRLMHLLVNLTLYQSLVNSNSTSMDC